MQIPANRERSKPSRDREGADAAHALKIRETVNPGILSKLMNRLYYGDNLTVLRGCIDNESVDLVYLDPPFNSQATYNVLFRVASGERSRARIEAFDDTWHWGDEAELAFDGVMTGQNSEAAEMLRSMRAFLKENDMMAKTDYTSAALTARAEGSISWPRVAASSHPPRLGNDTGYYGPVLSL
jgi:hypothetical protein